MKLKHRLPHVATLNHLSLTTEELQNLQNLVTQLQNKFVSVLEANRSLCGIHHTLASGAYENFFQIALTDSSAVNPEITLEECEVAHQNFVTDRPIESMRLKQDLTVDPHSPYNEHTYTVKTRVYEQNRGILDSVFSRFRGLPTRARLVKLDGGTTVAPHIDYDPAYAVRVIIPVFATPQCLNLFWDRGTVHTYTLEPGVAYFLNTGYRHAVVNFDRRPRYTVLVSVRGTEDISHLID